MFTKSKILAAALVMTLAVIAAGCGSLGKSSMVMDMSDEKSAVIELNNAKEGEFVQSGYISVTEDEMIEVVSDLNDGGKVDIEFIAVPEEQSIDELPDMDNVKYEMMISGKATQGGTFEPGEYDLKVTVGSKATGTVTLNVKPVADTMGSEGGHTNWTQAATAEEACEGAGLDTVADLNGTKTTLGVLGEMGEIKYRYMDGIVQTFCPVAAVDMCVNKGRIPSGSDGDISMDFTAYKYEWTQNVNGQEVKCFGNREGEATKTIWTAGDYNYAILAYGAGGDDDFGLNAEDVATMVNAVK